MATRKKKNNIGAFGHPIYGKWFAKYGEMRPNGSSEIPKDLESYAQKVEDYYDVGEEMGYLCVHRGEVKDAVIAGAKWQKEQMMKEAVEGADDEGGGGRRGYWLYWW